MREVIRRALPRGLRRPARWLDEGRDRLLGVWLDRVRFCPVCGSQGVFGPGPSGRPDARCPGCGSLERHRLLWLYLSMETDLLAGPKRLLQFAPEPCLLDRLKQVPGLDLTTGDIASELADVKLDIQALPFEDSSFDCILCSHVLEHIPDDRLAMRELRRVLRPGGWALVNVPVKGEVTFEDPDIVSPEDRTRHFGQWDHLRFYGRDIEGRLKEAGFEVRAERFADRFEPALRTHLRLAGELLFTCTRPE